MTVRRLLYAVAVSFSWMMLWDRFNVANFVAGLLVAAGMLAVFPISDPHPSERRHVNPLALAWLGITLVVDVVRSNWTVTRLVMSRDQSLRTGIVACSVSSASPKLMSTLANICALAPGMMVVEAVNRPPTLFVHVLTLDDPRAVRGRIARLERQVVTALGTPAERAAYERSVEAGA